MSFGFKSWFAYGLGARAYKAIFDDGREAEGRGPPREPIRSQTEEEIRADEKRYDEEAKELAAQGAAEKKEKRTPR